MSGLFRTFECRENHGGESHNYQGRQQHDEQQLLPRVARGKHGPPGVRGQQGPSGPKGEEGKSCDLGEIDKLQETVKELQGGLQDLTNQFKADKERLQHDVQVLTNKLKISSAEDCGDLQDLANFSSGVYTIHPTGLPPTDVWCDKDEDGLVWTTIQKRTNGSVDFNREFSAYEKGFGDASGEYWAGLQTINRLTMNGDWQLHVELVEYNGSVAHASYGSFQVGNSPYYILSVSSYSGNAGDSLASSNGAKFSTPKEDQDGSPNGNCAKTYRGGWWYNFCTRACLNAFRYAEGSTEYGFRWWHLHRNNEAISGSTMKIRKTQNN